MKFTSENGKRRLCFGLLALSFGLWMLTGAFALAAEADFATIGAGVSAKAYPDADTVLLDDTHHFRYNPDGTGSESDDYCVKILTEKGRQEYRKLEFHYNTFYSKFELRALEIYRDGKRIIVDLAANMREMTEPGQMNSNIYDPNNKLVIASIPDLQLGDVVRIHAVQTEKKARIPGVWCSFVSLESTAPILRYNVTVDAPASLPLARKMVKDSIPGTVTETEEKTGDRILYRWSAKNVPQAFPEPQMPPLYTCAQRLILSTAPDWETISRWYYNLCRPRLNAVTPAMREQVARLVHGMKTPRDRAMALFQFVSKEIRYMGITAEDVGPGYEPHDVSLTFANRYGVCRDKMALLVSLLEIAGFKAYPVLFYAGTPKDDEVPNNYFNHAIAAVELEPGNITLMDPTFETTTEFLPASMSNMSYLLADPKGRTLQRSPVVPAERNFIRIATDGEISAEGVLAGRSKIAFDGVNDQIYRDALSRWPLEYRRQFFGGVLKSVLPGAELSELTVSPEDVRDMGHPLELTMTFRVPGCLPGGNTEFLLALPQLGHGFGAVNFVLDKLALEKRKYPLEIYSTCGVRESFKLRLPEGIRAVSVPDFRPLESPGLRWTNRMAFDNNVFSGERELVIDRVRLEPSEYSLFKDGLRQIERASRSVPVFVRDAAFAARGADAVCRKWNTEYAVSAQDRWKETTDIELEIRNYAGVKRESELKIPYNPVWEELQISNAAVVRANGEAQPLTEKEVNRFDAPDAAAAPRYPGGKLLVVNFPGVEPGSLIRYRLVRLLREQPLFGKKITFGASSPVLERTVVFRDGVGLKFSPTPFGVARSDNGSVIRFTARNLPAIAPEPNQAPAWLFAPTLFVSGGNYNTQGKALMTALTAAAQGEHSAAVKHAASLTADAKSAREKITRLRDFVARDIRHAGPALNQLPWRCFSTPDTTLESRYGNSADRAILLFAMLSSLDIPVEFVAVGRMADAFTAEQSRWFQNYPDWEFDRVLVLADRLVYLNDTSEYARLGATPSYRRRALSGAGITRVSALEPTRRRMDATLRLDQRGDGELEVKLFYSGDLYERENRRFAEFTPETRSRYFRELASRFGENAEPVGTLKSDFSVYPGMLSFKLSIAGLVGASGAYRSLELPLFGDAATAIPAQGGERKTPVWCNDELNMELNYRVIHPASWQFRPLAPGLYRDHFPTGRLLLMRRQTRADQVDVELSLATSPGMIEANDFGSILNLYAELSAPKWRTLMFFVP